VKEADAGGSVATAGVVADVAAGAVAGEAGSVPGSAEEVVLATDAGG